MEPFAPMEIEAITKDGEVIPLSRDLGLRGRVFRVGWELPSDLTEQEWRAGGEMLGKIERSVSWWLGDWWAFGNKRYGDGKAIVESENWDGPAYGTCRNAASVAERFELSRRRDNLTFKHHVEVAGLGPDEADAVLDWAEEPVGAGGKPRSTREVRAEVSRRRPRVGSTASRGTSAIERLEGLVESGAKFGCIYGDPPWVYDNQGTRAATGNHYDGLTVEELCALPIGKLAADDAQLHLWTTNGFLFECPKIFEAWGFEFRSSLVWVKPQMGIGNYWRNSHEFLLTAIRGKAKRFNDHSMMSWIQCDRGAHSAKPQQVRSMLERGSPGPYLELFGRLPIDGWTVWGNQIEDNLFSIRDAAE